MNISKMNKAHVLQALYNAAKPQEIGVQAHSKPMDLNTAVVMIIEKANSGQRLYFDYVWGRVLKVDLTGDWLDTFLYDRDNGPNAAFHALKEVPEKESRGSWRKYFADAEVPIEIELLDLLEDKSYQGFCCPGFEFKVRFDEDPYMLWVEHLDPELRSEDCRDDTRFAISKGIGNPYLIETDDLKEVFKKIHELMTK